MMIVTDEAEFDNVCRVAAGLTCRLFVNDVKPSYRTVLADLIEADGGTYSPVTLMREHWAREGDSTVLTYLASIPFRGIPQTVFGWYLERGNKLFGAERLDKPWRPDGKILCINGLSLGTVGGKQPPWPLSGDALEFNPYGRPPVPFRVSG